MILGTVPIRGTADIWEELKNGRNWRKGKEGANKSAEPLENSNGLDQSSASMRDLRWDGRIGFSKHPTRLKC